MTPPPKPEEPVGALERPSKLAAFFDALAALEKGDATDDVRISQFGDSHTAADYETGTVRRQLQARFGDGGRGFVMLGRPWKAWSQEGVLSGMTEEWKPAMTPLGPGRVAATGVFGLAGVALFSRTPGARAWTDVLAPTTRVELAYLQQPGGGSVDVFIDNAKVDRLSTRADASRSAFRAFEVTEEKVHHIEVHPVGDGDVRIFGIALDRAAQHGIVLDALGINGARVTTALSWSETHWEEQLQHRAPALVILAYGTNDSVDVEMSQATFEEEVAEEVSRVTKAVPKASCLLLGPPDRAIKIGGEWKTAPKVLEIIAAEKKIAEAAGCAFYDRFQAMGGEGSMAKWSAVGNLALQDRVHLTREGYATVGTAFVSDLLKAYDARPRPTTAAGPSASRSN